MVSIHQYGNGEDLDFIVPEDILEVTQEFSQGDWKFIPGDLLNVTAVDTRTGILYVLTPDGKEICLPATRIECLECTQRKEHDTE